VRTLAVILIVIAGLVAALVFGARQSDGPLGPLPGGKLRSGDLVTQPHVDWSAYVEDDEIKVIELQLENPTTSRLAGVFVHEGKLYVACDLGFMGYRAPGFLMYFVQRLVLSLKRWHLDVSADGRVVLRMGGKRFERFAVRVTDPHLQSLFRKKAEEGAVKFFGSILDKKTDPAAIWFFRLDPRADA